MYRCYLFKQGPYRIFLKLGTDHTYLTGNLCCSVPDLTLTGYIIEVNEPVGLGRKHTLAAENRSVLVSIIKFFEALFNLLLGVLG